MNIKKIGFLVVILFISFYLKAEAFNDTPRKNKDFVTEITSIRKIASTKIKNKPALFISGLTGEVGCYTTNGKLIWKGATPTNNALVFDIEAADINGDGQDEYLAVSADSYVHCWDSEGKTLWNYNPGVKVRLSQIAVLEKEKGADIFVGGNNNTLYKLNEEGALVSKAKCKGAMARMEVGNFINKNKPSLFVLTYKHDKFNWAFNGILNTSTLEVIKEYKSREASKLLKGGVMVTDLKVSDINKDGKDDILYFATKKDSPIFLGLDGDFKTIASFTVTDRKEFRKSRYRYAHAIGTSLTPVKDQILIQHGRIVYLLDTEGKLIERTSPDKKKERFAVNSICFHEELKCYYGAGEVSGGNAVYTFDIASKAGWKRNPKLIGRIAEVNENLKELYNQVLKFNLPTYQKPAEKPWVMVYNSDVDPKVKRLKGAEVVFTHVETWVEGYDRSHMVAEIGEVALKKDGRKSYKKKQDYFVNRARNFEKEKKPFMIWSGHGNDPFYMHIETMEKILEVAPTTCYGFVYAEMSNAKDPRSHYYVHKIIPRLAKAMRKNGIAKLYYRYKQTFWATEVQLEPWRSLFLSKKYKDLLIPCTEDTNSYTQDLNLAGRIGMMQGGYIDQYGIRLIDDNVTGWRPFAPAAQKSISPFVRSGVIRAAYGATHGLIYNFSGTEEPGLNLFWALMSSGVLPQANKDNIESIGSWHLIDGINEKVLEKGHTGHNVDKYNLDDKDDILSVTGVHWAGASVPEHDFSKQALGVNYRWLHFLPELPNGMVPIAPAEQAENLKMEGVPFTVSDVKYGFKEGKEIPAEEFGKMIGETAKKGAKKLLVNVSGVSWSAIRLDENHIRVILLDKGYLDPKERKAIIIFNGTKPSSVKDILSDKEIRLLKNKAEVAVPAGSMKFIDLTY